MTRPPKAVLLQPPRLELYAAAQVREREIREACATRCADCPGPLEEGGCLDREPPGSIAGRGDWPICPWGMLQLPTWQAVVDLWFASKVSPLSGWPDAYSAFVVDALGALDIAVKEHQRKEHERASAAARTGGPTYTNRRAAKV